MELMNVMPTRGVMASVFSETPTPAGKIKKVSAPTSGIIFQLSGFPICAPAYTLAPIAAKPLRSTWVLLSEAPIKTKLRLPLVRV